MAYLGCLVGTLLSARPELLLTAPDELTAQLEVQVMTAKRNSTTRLRVLSRTTIGEVRDTLAGIASACRLLEPREDRNAVDATAILLLMARAADCASTKLEAFE
jgi:hypothetical protein